MYMELHNPPSLLYIHTFEIIIRKNFLPQVLSITTIITNINYKVVFPSARGIELILLGGMSPTSVTTAVMYVGGVKSYNGFSISRFCPDGTVFELEFRRVIVIGTFEIRIISNTQ